MKKTLIAMALGLTAAFSAAVAETKTPAPAQNGMTIPEGWQNWRLIAVSQRTENSTLRGILGNSVAVDAARSGKTNPWPEGAIIAKINWKQKSSETFPTAIVPAELIHVDFMLKDSQKYAGTGGWGWARWLGLEQKVYDKGDVAQECLGCHGMVKGQDYVFTHPAPLP
jgi:hypothetical protein